MGTTSRGVVALLAAETRQLYSINRPLGKALQGRVRFLREPGFGGTGGQFLENLSRCRTADALQCAEDFRALRVLAAAFHPDRYVNSRSDEVFVSKWRIGDLNP